MRSRSLMAGVVLKAMPNTRMKRQAKLLQKLRKKKKASPWTPPLKMMKVSLRMLQRRTKLNRNRSLKTRPNHTLITLPNKERSVPL
jgi:hypothetical protein